MLSRCVFQMTRNLSLRSVSATARGGLSSAARRQWTSRAPMTYLPRSSIRFASFTPEEDKPPQEPSATTPVLEQEDLPEQQGAVESTGWGEEGLSVSKADMEAPSNELLRSLNFDLNTMLHNGTRIPFGEWSYTPTEGTFAYWFKNNVFDNLVAVARVVHEGFHYIHDLTGLPWWLVIVGISLTYRGLSFTLLFGSARRQAKMAQMNESLLNITTTYSDVPIATNARVLMMSALKRAQIRHYGTQVYKAILPAVAVTVASIVFSFSCRNLLVHDTAFETEGILWFTNLALADPYHVLPVIMVILGYTYTELIKRKIGVYALSKSAFPPEKLKYLEHPRHSFIGVVSRMAHHLPRFLQMFFIFMYPYYYIFPAGFFLYFIPMMSASCLYRVFLHYNPKYFGFHDKPLELYVPPEEQLQQDMQWAIQFRLPRHTKAEISALYDSVGGELLHRIGGPYFYQTSLVPYHKVPFNSRVHYVATVSDRGAIRETAVYGLPFPPEFDQSLRWQNRAAYKPWFMDQEIDINHNGPSWTPVERKYFLWRIVEGHNPLYCRPDKHASDREIQPRRQERENIIERLFQVK